MKRRSLLILALGLCTVMTGCSSAKAFKDAVQSAESAVEKQKAVVTSEEVTVTADNADKEATDSAETPSDVAEAGDTSAAEKDGDTLAAAEEGATEKTENVAKALDTSASSEDASKQFEELISGQGSLSFSYYRKNVFKESDFLSYIDGILVKVPADREFTLAELKDEFNEIFNSEDGYYAEGEVSSVRYSYLDCGNDGIPEMSIQMTGPFIEPESDLTLIVKEIEGQLQVVYAYVTWSRSWTEINEYGFISGDGSNGASNHCWDTACVNADGQYLFGYYEEQEYDFDMFAHFKDHDDYDLSKLDGSIMTYSLRLNEYSEDSPAFQYYTYEVYDSESYEPKEVTDLYTDSAYKKVMDCFKEYNIVSMDEYEKIKSDKLTSIGATKEIMSGKNLTYKEITLKGGNSSASEKETEPLVKAPAGSIQREMADMEAQYQDYVNLDWGAMNQHEMNTATEEMFNKWDSELNSLWSRIVESVTPEEKEKLLADQRKWIKYKEEKIKEAGMEAEGGSMQPQLEYGIADALTRQRCYELAEILAKAKGEEFTIPAEVEKSFESDELTLDKVFEKFEGQWIFDIDRGAVIGVESSATCDYAPEGSTWTVWVTGGDTLSDLDVIDYTEDSITFHTKYGTFDAYHQLRFNAKGNVEMAYGTSLDSMDDVLTAH
ncbi:lysozyme inhibitor LprI family protein [Butyrivibrio sp. AC2005]|uniref:lysozyme inhibitor LprI family protein n=1 Tax=Butyrivibrio sp. AC2005 TaxID=1280672 RepID=UPI000677FC01|nr:lysozyme inhibitor LprI family protein [Butyrivibrio sp. AC2005]